MQLQFRRLSLGNTFWRVLEWLAVACNLAYTGLYILNSLWCWYFAMFGSVAFTILCVRAALYSEAGLYVFYLGMAIWGQFSHEGAAWYSESVSSHTQLILILVCSVIVLILGAVLKNIANAKLPYLDAATTVYSILATWLMVNYVHDNWLYWMVIDAVSIYLYANRRLYAGAAMFVIYFVMAVYGYFSDL